MHNGPAFRPSLLRPRNGMDKDLPGSPLLGDIMQAITFTRESIDTKIDSLVVDPGLLREDQRRLAERVPATELMLAALSPGLTVEEVRITKMEKQTENPDPAADAEMRKDTGREPWRPLRRKHKWGEAEPWRRWPHLAWGWQPALDLHDEGNRRIDSEVETAGSAGTSLELTAVTPGTSDCII
ncbi:hypothetical protein NDU88_003704 [Pleurodeles waltl]|uniref:Uncharacterized protein n=1 Tax=Pleurodeles waltl TaxID=8319 RepID=A0AAV7VGJ2_PLEWA|nr:hypothetical protein NDU88_003704 [Pleurodeles waltl]